LEKGVIAGENTPPIRDRIPLDLGPETGPKSKEMTGTLAPMLPLKPVSEPNLEYATRHRHARWRMPGRLMT
jgi:hypothetical protein